MLPATSRKSECRSVIHEYHVIAIKVVKNSEKLRKFFSVSNNVSYIVQETFLHQYIKIFQKGIKSKVKTTLVTFLDFAYFSCFLQAEITA